MAILNTNNCLNSKIEEIKKPQNFTTINIELDAQFQTYLNGNQCPHCKSRNVKSNGKYKNRKRYQCKECKKYFNDLTNTPFGGMHNHEKVKKYLQCMLEGSSIRQAAKIVGIAVSTSFKWRHKLLDKLNRITAPKRKEVVEIKEIKIPFSAKGYRRVIPKKLATSFVSIVFACDRAGKVDSDSEMYRLRFDNQVFSRLDNLNSRMLVASNANVFNKIQNEIFTDKSYIVDRKVSEWNSWMIRFKGVATKYLRNYLHWFDFISNSRNKDNIINSMINLLLHHERKCKKSSCELCLT
jgi:transposase-like protein